LQDDGFGVTQCHTYPAAFFGVVHNLSVVGVQAVVLEEGTGVLRDRFQWDTEAGERLSAQRMGVRGRDHVGPRPVYLRVDAECGVVDRALAFRERAVVVDEDEVRDPYLAERHPEGVHSESRGVLRVAGGDVPRHALGETEAGEQTEGRREFLLPDLTLLLDAQVLRWQWQGDAFGHGAN
jgi:hypothetical protein